MSRLIHHELERVNETLIRRNEQFRRYVIESRMAQAASNDVKRKMMEEIDQLREGK